MCKLLFNILIDIDINTNTLAVRFDFSHSYIVSLKFDIVWIFLFLKTFLEILVICE